MSYSDYFQQAPEGFGIDPDKLLKLVPIRFDLTKEKILSIGWKNYRPLGLGFTVTKGFDGNSWYELYCEKNKDNNIIEITITQVTRKNEKLRYLGPCYTIDNLQYLEILFNIKL